MTNQLSNFFPADVVSRSRAHGFVRAERGITLVELLVVLVVLIGVASIAVTSFSDGVSVRGADGESREAGEIVTLETMQTVRDAFIGTSLNNRGYIQDVGSFRDSSDSEAPNADDLGCLIVQSLSGEPDYDPARKRGWNGPYLVDAAVRFDSDFPIGTGFNATNGFAGFATDDLLILDGWGSPLVLGHENGTDFYWLVSAGPDRNLNTELEDSDHDSNNNGDVEERGDDIVLFLLTSDPNL